MKKPIQITEKNAAAIEAALAEVNGRAEAHAYTSFSEIEQLAKAAEARLSALGILKKNAQGARWTETSGSEVSNAYAKKSRSRTATTVRLERKSAGWYLVQANKTEIWQQGGGAGRIALTPAQAEQAIASFRAGFSIAAE